jgi:cytochrome bd-type quinol oxidase subunit 2
MRERSGRVARRVAPVTGAVVVAFVIWTRVTARSTFFLNPVELLAVLAVILLQVVLVYQTWTYYIFRRRLSQQQFQPSPQRRTPLGPPTATPDGAAPAGQEN